MMQGSGWGTCLVSEDEFNPGLLCVLDGHVPLLGGAGPIPLVPTAQTCFYFFVVAFQDQDPPTAINQGHLEGAKDVISHMFPLAYMKQRPL